MEDFLEADVERRSEPQGIAIRVEGPPDEIGDEEARKAKKRSAVVKGLLQHRLQKVDNEASEILPGLFLGSSGALANLRGVSHVVRCADLEHTTSTSASTSTSSASRPAGGQDEESSRRRFLDLRMRDAGEFLELRRALFETEVLDFIQEGRGLGEIGVSPRAEGSGCLVCCRQGRSRSVAVTAAFLMLREGFSLDAALKRIQEKRPVARPNVGFVLCLRKLEREMTVGARDDGTGREAQS
eukprot:g11609.t1